MNLGLPIVDNAYLEDAARETERLKRWEFMLVVEAVRDAVTAWRVLQNDEQLEREIFWHLPRSLTPQLFWLG